MVISPAAGRAERLAALRGAIRDVEEREGRKGVRRAERLSAAMGEVPGEVVNTAHGPLHRLRNTLGTDHCHGRAPVGRALEVEGGVLAKLALDPTLDGVDLRRLLIFDTETTGLSGGTGTLPFLIGTAWFDGTDLSVEQLFLRKPGEEGPMLRRFAEQLAGASLLVSFNGKSFDWPMVRDRCVLHRLAAPSEDFAPPHHLDLLHLARRRYRRELPDCRLQTLERYLCGRRRAGDIPGSEIPAAYHRFARTGAMDQMQSVLHHNALDLVTLLQVSLTLAAAAA
ncbi:MAG: ribonuclease H-like domain-containing protein [Myxococcales bacterium]|nr:ribonuclease H-like domain-containing protein [Myxococcales bacterium]